MSTACGRRVHLRVLDAGLQPDAANGQTGTRCRLDNGRPRLARHVGVVEHDARDAGLPQFLEPAQQTTQRSARVIAVQPRVAVRDERAGRFAFAGPRQAHDAITHLATAAFGGWLLDAATCRRAQNRCGGHALVESGAIVVCQLQVQEAAERGRRFDPRRAGNRHDHVRQIHEPRERDVEGADTVTRGDVGEQRVGRACDGARRGPPRGVCAIRRIPFATQYAATPLNRLSSFQILSST